MKKNEINSRTLSDMLWVSPELIVRAAERTIKVLRIKNNSLKLKYEEFEALSERLQDKEIYAEAMLKLDEGANCNEIEKLKCFVKKESDYFPEEIDMELAINKRNEISFIDHKAPYGGYRSISTCLEALTLSDREFKIFLRKLRDDTIDSNKRSLERFKEIASSKNPVFEVTFKKAKEHLKNLKFPTIEDLKYEKAVNVKPFTFKNTKDPCEQMKIAMWTKRSNNLRLRSRLPYLFQIMLYHFHFVPLIERGGVEILYGRGWNNLACRKYCKYINDHNASFDLAEYYGENLGEIQIKHFNENYLFAWFDGNDVLDRAFDELIALDYEAVCSSDEEFIAYLKKKRDEILSHVESIEKSVNSYIKKGCSPIEDRFEEKQQNLKNMRF